MPGRDSAMLLQALMSRRGGDSGYGDAMRAQAEEATQRQVLADAADAWQTGIKQRSGRQGLQYGLVGNRENRAMLERQAAMDAAAKAAELQRKMATDLAKLANDWEISQAGNRSREKQQEIIAAGGVKKAQAGRRPLGRTGGVSEADRRVELLGKNLRASQQAHARLASTFGKDQEVSQAKADMDRNIRAFVAGAKAAGYPDEVIVQYIEEGNAAPGAGRGAGPIVPGDPGPAP